MKEKKILFLKRIIAWLQARYDKLVEKDNSQPYYSLSPIDDADPENQYSDALLWAIKNRKEKDIKNIALTGPYGSGKSSILKTFQKNNRGIGLHFLNISLATFKEEIDKNIKPPGNETLRLIELSILQQIFYHEDDSKIPDSRFKKIKSYSRPKLVLYSIGILIFLLSLMSYNYPYLIQSVFKDFPLSNLNCNWIHYLSISIIVIGFFFIVFKSIRIISALKIDKFSIQNAEIKINDSVNKSILNHHLDELMYFFSIRPYNVVIIEDLDRFQETEIFTKLREINLLLNSSEKTKEKHIVFIYAVRDEMFKDKDRTKFFDFIIPVIPVINSSNSSQILLDKKSKNLYSFSESLIEDISLFIDDMRLLHNITNEFYLYKQKLDSNLSQDKLLAMLVYKNISPNDFVKLSNNEGVLYECFNSKSIHVENAILKVEKEITEISKQIHELDKVSLKNTEELRSIYVLNVLKHLTDFKSFVVNGSEVSFDDLIQDGNFEYLIENRLYYNQFYSTYSSYLQARQVQVSVSFKEIEKQIDELGYEKRKQLLDDFNSNKSESLKKKIKELERQKNAIRGFKIKDVLKLNPEMKIAGSDIANKDLINVLLRSGYIDEDYVDYISIFYEGSITRSDNQFLLCVKSLKKLDNNYKLNKIDKLIKKISPVDFESEYTLNYDLLDYLMAHEQYDDYKKTVFKKLSDQTVISLDFINNYIETRENVGPFVKLLCEQWYSIWKYFEEQPSYTNEAKEKYLKHILEYADLTSINLISNSSNLITTILKDPNFLNVINDKRKLIEIIKLLNIKFVSLNYKDSPTDLLDYIYANDCYEINIEMIKSLMKFKGKFNQVSFDNSNYFSLVESTCGQLVNYINMNINDYVKNVYLKIDANINEDESSLSLLVNNLEINLKNRQSIVEKVNTKISDLSKIGDLNMRQFLLRKNKVVATWENIQNEYEKSGKKLTNAIISFINRVENAELLSKVRLPTEVNGINVYGEISKEILLTEEVNSDAYKLITKSNPWWYKNLALEKLSIDKIASLIENNKLEPCNENFELLKTQFNELSIVFLEKHRLTFLKNQAEYSIDSKDLEYLLKSKIFFNQDKNNILQKLPVELITLNPENIKLIGDLILSDSTFNVQEIITRTVVLSSKLLINNRIKIFNRKHNQFSNENITLFLNGLGEPYSNITINGNRPLIEDNLENAKMAEILKSQGYISKFEKEPKGLRISTFKNK